MRKKNEEKKKRNENKNIHKLEFKRNLVYMCFFRI